MSNFKEFEDLIEYKFSDESLLKNALTHPSWNNDFKVNSFERLEFLGDRVLGFIVSCFLYSNFKNENEGNLSKRLALLVKKETCSDIAKKMNLEKFVLFSKNDIGKHTSIFADAVEAIMGAMFLDGGIGPCELFVKKFWKDLLDKPIVRDPKSYLQEVLQSFGKDIPKYILIKQEGSNHSPKFYVNICVDGFEEVSGLGKTKRESEKDAAEKFIEKFSKNFEGSINKTNKKIKRYKGRYRTKIDKNEINKADIKLI